MPYESDFPSLIQMITVPVQYLPSGIVPSNEAYSIGWSSVCTARRFGLREGKRCMNMSWKAGMKWD